MSQQLAVHTAGLGSSGANLCRRDYLPRYTPGASRTALFVSSTVSRGISVSATTILLRLREFLRGLVGIRHGRILPNLTHTPANATIFITSVSVCAQQGQ